MTQKFYNCRGAIYLTSGCELELELCHLETKHRDREGATSDLSDFTKNKKLAGFNANCQFKLITQI